MRRDFVGADDGTLEVGGNEGSGVGDDVGTMVGASDGGGTAARRACDRYGTSRARQRLR